MSKKDTALAVAPGSAHGMSVSADGSIVVSTDLVQGGGEDHARITFYERRIVVVMARSDKNQERIKELHNRLMKTSPEYREMLALKEDIRKDKKIIKETLVKVEGEYEWALPGNRSLREKLNDVDCGEPARQTKARGRK